MIAYYRKYMILVCAIAAGAAVLVSTVWPLLTGMLMMATLEGLLVELAVFFGALIVSYRYFSRKAEGQTEAYIARYDAECDPGAFIEEARELAGSIAAPYAPPGAWFLAYYAQALLDAHKPDAARAIFDDMVRSVDAAKKAEAKAAILSNAIVVAVKLDEVERARELVEQSGAYLDELGVDASDERRVFTQGQRSILRARAEGDHAKLAELFSLMRNNTALPLRARVECAWNEGRARYALGDAAGEASCLEFVVANGNKLALVEPARNRLASLRAV